MDPYQQVKEKLDELGISFDVVEHPPAFTTEQADLDRLGGTAVADRHHRASGRHGLDRHVAEVLARWRVDHAPRLGKQREAFGVGG